MLDQRWFRRYQPGHDIRIGRPVLDEFNGYRVARRHLNARLWILSRHNPPARPRLSSETRTIRRPRDRHDADINADIAGCRNGEADENRNNGHGLSLLQSPTSW